jgi:Tfp pilus assembly PilM family ATPase
MKFRSLLHFFPPPAFLDPLCAGISVSDTSIRFFEFERKQNYFKIKKYLEYVLPVGAVVSGNINNADEVVYILDTIKKETGVTNIRASLPEEKAYLFKTSIPHVKPKDMRAAIEATIEDNIPLSPDKVFFDFNVVNQDDDVKNRTDVVVSAIPTTVIDIYMDVFTRAGFVPYGLEIESQSIARAVLHKKDKGTHMIVHCAPQKIGLYIVSDRAVHFTSTVAVKVDSSVTAVAHEVKKIIAFWYNLDTEKDTHLQKIQDIIITGEGFNEMFVSELEDSIKIHVSVGNVWSNAFDITQYVPDISFTDSVKYASAIGLALPTHILI